MSNYLLPYNNTIDYFYFSPKNGICKKQYSNMHWSRETSVYKNALSDFCAYRDFSGINRIICTNSVGDLIYITEKNNAFIPHTLVNSNGRIFPTTIKVSFSENKINLFYTAALGDELLLIYCPLDTNAKPIRADTVSASNPHFCLCGSDAYYTDSDNSLIYCNFSSGFPENRTVISENAYMPYAYTLNDSVNLVYLSDGKIMLNNNIIFEDPAALHPIISQNGNDALLLWQSGGFIHYSASSDNFTAHTRPMRFSASDTHIYYVQNNHSIQSHYGTLSAGKLHLIGDKHLFSSVLPKNTPSETEYENLKNDVTALRNELYSAKQEINRLIALLSGNNDK